VPLVPTLILLAGSVLVWITRREHERMQWALSTGVAVVVWVVSLGFVMLLPIEFQVSVWKPEDLFSSKIFLSLDRVSWSFVYATATLTMTVFLCAQVKADPPKAGVRCVLLVQTGLAMLAMMAGNLLTVAITWALMDIGTLVLMKDQLEDVRSSASLIARSAANGGGVLLILGSALANEAVGGHLTFEAPSESPLGTVLLVLAVLLRLGLFPPQFSETRVAAYQRSLGTLLRLLPPAAAMAILARQMDIGAPAAVTPWLRWTGLFGVMVGSARWLFGKNTLIARPFIVLGITGLGMLATSFSTSRGGMIIVATGVMLLLIGAVTSLGEIFSPIHRLWFAMSGLILIGAPGTPGSVIASALIDGIKGEQSIIAAVLGGVGMAALGIGTLRTLFAPTQPWETGESLARLTYGLGLSVPIFAAVGVGIHMRDQVQLDALWVFLILIVISAAGLRTMKNLSQREVDRWGKIFAWLDPSPLYSLGRSVGKAVGAAIRSVGELIEVEGGILWMIVILLLVGLALGARS
jgi:formate hydrogenlyase subunit 3/multisubunit Na+/H+ antiporter MnhD subunit